MEVKGVKVASGRWSVWCDLFQRDPITATSTRDCCHTCLRWVGCWRDNLITHYVHRERRYTVGSSQQVGQNWRAVPVVTYHDEDLGEFSIPFLETLDEDERSLVLLFPDGTKGFLALRDYSSLGWRDLKVKEFYLYLPWGWPKGLVVTERESVSFHQRHPAAW